MTATTMTELAGAMLAYLPFMADTADYSGHGRDASASTQVTYRPGPFGSAASFQRLGSRVTVPAIYPTTGLGSYTIAAWVRIDAFAPVAGDAAPVATIAGSLRLRHRDGMPIFEFPCTTSGDSGTQIIPLEATRRLQLGQWTHIAVAFDAKALAIRLYLNGILDAEGPIPQGVAPLEPTLGVIGAADSTGQAGVLNGSIGHVMYFNDVLGGGCLNAIAGYMTYPVGPSGAAGDPAIDPTFFVAAVIVALLGLVWQTQWNTKLEAQKSADQPLSVGEVASRIAVVAGRPVNPSIKVTREQIGIDSSYFVKLDVGGYGVYKENCKSLSGIPGTLNLNDKALNPNGCPKDSPVPALVLMPDWGKNPEYPFEDGFADYIVMQSAPLTPTNVAEINRVLRIGGSVGLWIAQDDYKKEIADLAAKLNCTPLPCTQANGNLGMDEMQGRYVFPKLQLTKEKPMSIPGTFTLYNGGGYVARLKVRYTLRGTEVTEKTEDILLGTSKSLGVPAGAIDIFVTAEEHTGFSWNEIGTHGFGAPVTRCYQCWGTTFDPKWGEYNCSAEPSIPL